MNARERGRIARAIEAFPAVRLAYLYGSALSGRGFRDVDLALGLGAGRRPGFDTLGLRLKAAAALGRLLPWEFDVHVLEEMPLSLQYRVVATGRCVLRRSELERTRYEARVLTEFLDFKPTHDWLVRRAMERAARP